MEEKGCQENTSITGVSNSLSLDLTYELFSPDFLILYKQAKKLLSEEDPDFRELGRILLKLMECLKLELFELFPEPPKEKKRPQRNYSEEETNKEESVEEYTPDLSFLYHYVTPVGRKQGSKPVKTLQEFFREFIPIHKGVNYEEIAEDIVKKVRSGVFKLKTISEFIALLYAYQLGKIEEEEIIKIIQTV